ncbi:MAG TPA: STAS domain-containing protein [Chitinispirillaceae bacterium]|nr:STAS domain-containing protein [Chitinispirillaceae bacterium]
MEIVSSVSGNVSTFNLIGQLWRKDDLSSFEAAVEGFIAENRMVLVLDISRLSFVNSQGLGLLVRCHVKLKERGVKMILFGPNEAVSEVVELSGFGMFMTIVKTNDDLSRELAKLI